jgi:energy-coupling factor transporter ATP-binding protein EcfA2
MITELRLQNFRGFDDHVLPLGSMTVVVGENNAGKTTIVEALRLVSMVTLRYRSLGFQDPPGDTDLPRRLTGVSPSLKNVEINFNTIFHRYGEQPGTIVASFRNGSSITIYVLANKRLHAVIRDPNGDVVRSRSQAQCLDLAPVWIMPQVAPLQRDERILMNDYVQAAMSSRLAPLHFRNQLKVRYDLFSRFKDVVEETWPGVQIYELIGRDRRPGEELRLEIRNEDFVAEVAEMGHGLQMWLQAMWFLTLARDAATVILDEPDVYMHADLQRRIIRFLRNRHSQTIVTTHSVEIMSEVQPDDILVVDKRRRESSFAGSVPAVQAAINRCGSVHNFHLTRLLSAQKMILVEGKDLGLLKVFQDTMFPDSQVPFRGLPHMSIGGWSGWKLAVGSSMGFRNALGQDIKCYCILDSDYHSPQEIAERYREAHQRGVQLHIWERKEIENYLLVPAAIARLIAKRVANRVTPPSATEIKAKIIAIADDMEDEIFDAMATEFLSNDRSLRQTGANRSARQRIHDLRRNTGDLTSIASGKALLSALAGWSKSEFGVSFSAVNVAGEITIAEMQDELLAVIRGIESGDGLPAGPTG